MLVAPPPIYHAGNRYWVRILKDHETVEAKQGDLVLIDPCPRRQPNEEDPGRVFAMSRSGKSMVDVIEQRDVDKRRTGVEIFGTALILHRNLQE